MLVQQAMPEADKPAQQTAGKPSKQTAGKRSRKDKMKGSIGVTDNDWFAFLSQQPGDWFMLE
jgi:hypothetical protein